MLKNTVIAMKILAVAGRNTFMCSFEETADCLLSDDDLTATETWYIVDGGGFIADNTMNNGQ